MVRKRKAPGEPRTNLKGIGDNGGSKLQISTYQDVADSEDEFHINRDKILLEDGPVEKRRKKWHEEDETLEPSDEEVLAYRPGESDLEGEDDDEDDDEEYDAKDVSKKQASNKTQRYASSENSEASEKSDEEDMGWGSSKRDYYNADTIETEQDALEEEAEALRLQKKKLQAMTEADFGFDENDWVGGSPLDDEERLGDDGDVVIEKLPELVITTDMGVEERIKIMRARYPELEPLAQEFQNMQSLHGDLALAAQAAEALVKQNGTTVEAQDKSIPVSVIKYRALLAYLGALSMYFAVLTSPAAGSKESVVALPAAELREHSVVDSLVTCRALWSRVANLEVPNSSDMVLEISPSVDAEAPAKLQDHELRETAASSQKLQKKKSSKKARAEAQAIAASEARRAERIRQTEDSLASLTTLSRPKKVRARAAKSVAEVSEDSDFGEDTALTPQEAALKAQKKRSLRFYTSQIAGKAAKRERAVLDAGGDADIPHRERFRDRQARLNAEAEARGKGRNMSAAGEALGDSLSEGDEEEARKAKEVREQGESEYYELVSGARRAKQDEKTARAQALDRAEKEGGRVKEVEEIGPDGKRKITYAIEKNKGLTPHRKKDVRNPRVKKRKKFEEKKKKLGSIRQVYKGGEGKGGYGGELTGIKTGVVRSVKL